MSPSIVPPNSDAPLSLTPGCLMPHPTASFSSVGRERTWSQPGRQPSCPKWVPLPPLLPLPHPPWHGHPVQAVPWPTAQPSSAGLSRAGSSCPHAGQPVPPLLPHPPPRAWRGPWRPGGRGGCRLPVLQGELGQLPVVVEPLELQWPAALGHAREHQAVPLQVHLRPRRLRLEIGGHVICGKQRHKATLSLPASFRRSFRAPVPLDRGSRCSQRRCPTSPAGRDLTWDQSDFRGVQGRVNPEGRLHRQAARASHP